MQSERRGQLARLVAEGAQAVEDLVEHEGGVGVALPGEILDAAKRAADVVGQVAVVVAADGPDLGAGALAPATGADAGDLVLHHRAGEAGLGEEDAEGVAGVEVTLDLLVPVLAYAQVLVDEDGAAVLAQAFGDRAGERALALAAVGVADEDLWPLALGRHRPGPWACSRHEADGGGGWQAEVDLPVPAG